MEFKEFCTIVKKWKEEGRKLIIKDLNEKKTDNVISYGIIKTTYKKGTIISFEINPSRVHMICENDNCEIEKQDENTYEAKVAKEHYQIIIK